MKCVLLVVVALSAFASNACYTLVAGKEASRSGRVIVAHNEDDYGELEVFKCRVPARSHRADATVPAESGKAILPQVEKTLAFDWTAVCRKDGRGGLGAADTMLNEKGVLVVSNNGNGIVDSDPARLTDGGIVHSLRRIVAERATSARDAVSIITNLVTTWGYAHTGRMYTVADRDEAWVVSIVHGRQFVARRCPDDAVTLIPNCYKVGRLEPGDIVSPRFARVPADYDFAKANQDPAHYRIPKNQLRDRLAAEMLTGEKWTDDAVFPFAVRPQAKVDAALLRKILMTKPILRTATVDTSVWDFAALPPPFAAAPDAAERFDTYLLPAPKAGGLDIGFLKDLVAIPSLTADLKEIARVVETLRGWLEKRGVFCAVETDDEGRKVLYAATSPGKCHDAVFVTHLDVVPAPERLFAAEVDGDRIYGRGTCDTKGNALAIAQVLVNLVGRNPQVGAVFATDEEKGAKVPTPTLLLNRGYVPRKFILVGDTAGEQPGTLFTAEKGHAIFTLVAHGRGGHSAYPWEHDNPIPRLCAGYLKFKAAWDAADTSTNVFRTVITPTMLEGSTAPNIVSDDVSMKLSCRFAVPEDYGRVLRMLRETSGLDVVEPAAYRPAIVNDPNDPHIVALLASLRKKWPTFTTGTMLAATDATRYAHLKLPTVLYGAISGHPHADGEWASLRDLNDWIEALTDHLILSKVK